MDVSHPPQLSESEIKKQIMEFLWLKGVFCWINSSTGIYDPKIGKFRKSNSKFQIKGTSDILGVFNGRALAIEVKSAKGKLSDDQDSFLTAMEMHGAIAFVARSIADVEQKLFG